MVSDSGADVLPSARVQLLSKLQMPPPRMLDQRPPQRRGETVTNQQMPEAGRSLVEIAHREIRQHCPAVARPASPDGRMREQPVVAPGVAAIELFATQVLRLEDDVRGVVLVPVSLQNAPLPVEPAA